MARVLAVAAMKVEVETAVPASVAAEMAPANPAGAAWTALAERTATSPLAPTVMPRLAKNSRKRSTARLTRLCAASSRCDGLVPFRGRTCVQSSVTTAHRGPARLIHSGRRRGAGAICSHEASGWAESNSFIATTPVPGHAGAHLGANDVGREILRGAMKPAGQAGSATSWRAFCAKA